jgi:hypothetical protein
VPEGKESREKKGGGKMGKLHDIEQKIRAFLLVERGKMRALGDSDADIREDAFIEMVSQKAFEGILHELGPDEFKALSKEMWSDFIERASPEKLRETAGKLRANGRGASEGAYDLEHLADLRERGAEFRDS